MPLVATKGAASAQGFGEFSQQTAVNYIEDVFSCFLYTGNGSTQTITNGIDLSGKGGMVWTKQRSGTRDNNIVDTVRGGDNMVYTNDTTAQFSLSGLGFSPFTFSSTGFVASNAPVNAQNATTFCSWTFRKQAKFFDVVTYTGNGANRTIAHNLDSVPGSIIIKRTDTTANWAVYHRSLANTQYLVLNSTAAAATGATWWNSTTPTSAVFSLGTDASVNASGGTYVAYIFAHDAGGFGTAGTDNVISCGSYVGDGTSSGPIINLGYEPQWVMIKDATTASQWFMYDTMRGMSQTSGNGLFPNLPNAESTGANCTPTATGFQILTTNGNVNASGDTFIYIAIRRGPMKTPTSGTEVFSPNAYTGTGAVLPITGMGFPPDFLFTKSRSSGNDWCAQDKLRGPSQYLRPNGAIAELNLGINQIVSIDQNGVTYGDGSSLVNFNGATYINLSFRRAPEFFDEVCYTGTGSTRTVTHNLGVTPELVITKSRSQGLGWVVWTTSLTNTDYWIRLDDTMAQANSPVGYGGTFSASNYTISNTGPYNALNNSGSTYVAYLFATVAGVSKVGSYTGTGALQTVNCGFTAGARFVMIKRTDSTGDWFVWDTARGIISGDDPYLLLNSSAAEVTNTDYVDTASSGFELSSTAPAAINANGGSFIFLAIA